MEVITNVSLQTGEQAKYIVGRLDNR